MRHERLGLGSSENGDGAPGIVFVLCLTGRPQGHIDGFVIVECLPNDSSTLSCRFSRGSVELEQGLDQKCIVCCGHFAKHHAGLCQSTVEKKCMYI